METPRYTLEELEIELPRMEPGHRFRIYGHRSVWTLERKGDMFYTLVSDLDRQINILSEKLTSTEMFKIAKFMKP